MPNQAILMPEAKRKISNIDTGLTFFYLYPFSDDFAPVLLIRLNSFDRKLIPFPPLHFRMQNPLFPLLLSLRCSPGKNLVYLDSSSVPI